MYFSPERVDLNVVFLNIYIQYKLCKHAIFIWVVIYLVKNQNLMIFDTFIHLMHLIVGKGNWVADYFKKQQRTLEGCLGMLSSKHTANIWLLF